MTQNLPHVRTALAVAACLALLGPPQTSAASAQSPPDVLELLRSVDDLMRGDSSQGTMTMRVKTKRFERQMSLATWSKGTEQSLIRILEPAKERGTATLKVGDKIWNYLPKIDRTIKVPGSMMSGSWMGSHFTNDDLVAETRYSEDFDCTLGEHTLEGGDAGWLVECIPHEDAPVVWGKVTVAVHAQDLLPRSTRYFDEDGELVRTMTFEGIRSVGGRMIPTTMRAIPADEPGEFTEVIYGDLRFDVELDDRLFSLQSLKE